MHIKHPHREAIIDLTRYADIRCCSKNPTHVDFYKEPQLEDERGTPTYTIVFENQDARDKWFDHLVDFLAPASFDFYKQLESPITEKKDD